MQQATCSSPALALNLQVCFDYYTYYASLDKIKCSAKQMVRSRRVPAMQTDFSRKDGFEGIVVDVWGQQLQLVHYQDHFKQVI